MTNPSVYIFPNGTALMAYRGGWNPWHVGIATAPSIFGPFERVGGGEPAFPAVNEVSSELRVTAVTARASAVRAMRGSRFSRCRAAAAAGHVRSARAPSWHACAMHAMHAYWYSQSRTWWLMTASGPRAVS